MADPLAIIWFRAWPTRGQMVTSVNDCYKNNNGTYRCNGFDEIGDTECWQIATNAAKAGSGCPFLDGADLGGHDYAVRFSSRYSFGR